MDCDGIFPRGSTVSLRPAATSGKLAAWGGACAGTQAGAPCAIHVTGVPAHAAATFAHQTPSAGTQTLTVINRAPEPSPLHSDPPGLICRGRHAETCTGRFASGTLVKLTGVSFTAWGGDCVGFTGACVVDVDSPVRVQWSPPGRGAAPPQFGVNVTISGPGEVIIGPREPPHLVLQQAVRSRRLSDTPGGGHDGPVHGGPRERQGSAAALAGRVRRDEAELLAGGQVDGQRIRGVRRPEPVSVRAQARKRRVAVPRS